MCRFLARLSLRARSRRGEKVVPLAPLAGCASSRIGHRCRPLAGISGLEAVGEERHRKAPRPHLYPGPDDDEALFTIGGDPWRARVEGGHAAELELVARRQAIRPEPLPVYRTVRVALRVVAPPDHDEATCLVLVDVRVPLLCGGERVDLKLSAQRHAAHKLGGPLESACQRCGLDPRGCQQGSDTSMIGFRAVCRSHE